MLLVIFIIMILKTTRFTEISRAAAKTSPVASVTWLPGEKDKLVTFGIVNSDS